MASEQTTKAERMNAFMRVLLRRQPFCGEPTLSTITLPKRERTDLSLRSSLRD
jgi:hypothetical protein